MAFILKQKCNPAFFAATLALLHNSSDGIVGGLNMKVQMKLASTVQMKLASTEPSTDQIKLSAAKRRLAAAKVLKKYVPSVDVVNPITRSLQDQQDANTLISFAQHCAEEYNGIDRNWNITTTRREKRQAIINLFQKISDSLRVTLADSLRIPLEYYIRPDDHVPVVGDRVPKWRRVMTKIASSNKRAALDPLKFKLEFYDAIVLANHSSGAPAEDIVDVFPREKVEKVDVFFRNKLPLALLRMARDLMGRAGKKTEEKVLQDLLDDLSVKDSKNNYACYQCGYWPQGFLESSKHRYQVSLTKRLAPATTMSQHKEWTGLTAEVKKNKIEQLKLQRQQNQLKLEKL